jgi:hypothetical protein
MKMKLRCALFLIAFLLIANTASAEEVKRLENETLENFARRIGPPESELTHSVIETEAWGHNKTVLAFYETEFKTSGQTESKIVGYIFLPQDANTYQKILIGTFEPEGGPPTIEAVFFANADRDKPKELIVICSWLQRHYDVSGTLYGTFIFDDLRPGSSPTELRFLESVSRRVSGDCECEWRNGKKRISRYKTAASVKVGLKKLGF